MTERLIRGHNLPYETSDELEEIIKSTAAKIEFESTGGDDIIKSFDSTNLDAILEKLDLENEPSRDERRALFETQKYLTLKKLIAADAITNIGQLERKLKEERYNIPSMHPCLDKPNL